MSIASVATLVEELRELGLLTPEQLDALPRAVAAGELKAVARDLIQRGWLTAYQINQLVQGRGRDLFLGPYLFLERLGEGGMGQVFKAFHRNLGRVDAVKVIRKDRLGNPNTLRRFQREVCATTRLDHPNIVRALDAGQVDDRWYFAMEYVAGTDLARRVLTSGPLPIAEACDYVRQAALGLQHAHERGMVHRDVKPHNLIVAPPLDNGPGLLKILDMGLALVTYSEEENSVSSLTREGLVMGTADYMAPEQAQNAHLVDIRADLYSLGCTLYHLLAGQVPFPGGALLEKLMKHRLDEAVRLEDLRPDVPLSVAALVRRLMAKLPEQRLQTPAELVAFLTAERTTLESRQQVKLPKTVVLAEVVSNKPVTSVRTTTPPPIRKRARKKAPVEVQPLPSPAIHQPRPASGRRRLPRWLLIGLAVAGVVVLMAILSALKGPSEDGSPFGSSVPSSTGAPRDARQAWEALQPLRGEDLRKGLLSFRAHYPGALQRAEATARLAQLPSPLDTINPDLDPRLEKLFIKPAGLVLALRPTEPVPESVRCVVFRPDGRELASGQGSEVFLWDVLVGDVKRKLPFAGAQVGRLAWSPDGKLLAAGGSNGKVQIWALEGKTERIIATDKHEITALAFSPDSRCLATADDNGKLTLWDLVPPVQPRAILSHGDSSRILCVAWSPDGRSLVAGSVDQRLRAWHSRTGALLWTDTKSPVWVFVAGFTPDGRTLLSGGGGDGALRVSRWSEEGLKEDRIVKSEQGPVVAIAPTPDGRGVFTADLQGGLMLRGLAQGEVWNTWQLPNPVRDLSVPCDGRHIAVPLDNGSIYVLRLPQRP